MTKKLLFVLCMLLATSLCSASNSLAMMISFETGYVDPNQSKGTLRPRDLVDPPTVYIEDFTLLFEASHPEYVLNIKDENGDVVYTTTVYSAQTQVVLPSTLSGNYQIELVMGNWLFTGWIEL